MSNQGYWNQGQGDSYQNHNRQQYGQGQGHDAYPSQYGQNQSYPSQQPSGYNQDNQPVNWGYGGHPQEQQNQYGHGHSGSQNWPPQQGYPQHQNQGYGQPYQNQDQYQTHGQPQQYGGAPPDHRGNSPNPPYGGQQYDQGYGQPQQGYPGGPDQAQAGERGLLGAIGGAAAGGFAGGKMGHGIIGALGGAYAGHKLEDTLKEKHKKKKHDDMAYGQDYSQGGSSHGGHHRRRSNSSSSSSSSSSDDEKKRRHHHHHHHRYETAGAAAATGAAAHHGNDPVTHALAGNFSASSSQISLDREYNLRASCGTVHHGSKSSCMNLNDCLTNSWGHLAWLRAGGFGASSRNVRLIDGGKVLEAEVGDGKGGWNMSTIRLDERITNDDGNLRFLG